MTAHTHLPASAFLGLFVVLQVSSMKSRGGRLINQPQPVQLRVLWCVCVCLMYRFEGRVLGFEGREGGGLYSHRTLPGPGRQRAGAPPSTPRGAVLGAQHFFIGGLRHLGLILSRLLFYVYVCVWVSCFSFSLFVTFL